MKNNYLDLTDSMKVKEDGSFLNSRGDLAA